MSRTPPSPGALALEVDPEADYRTVQGLLHRQVLKMFSRVQLYVEQTVAHRQTEVTTEAPLCFRAAGDIHVSACAEPTTIREQFECPRLTERAPIREPNHGIPDARFTGHFR